jgi:hypothetical protein
MYRFFSYADIRRIDKVFSIMKNLAKEDDFFASAVEEFESASSSEKVDMCNYLLSIYNRTADCDIMTLEQAVILSAYPA